MLYGISNTSKKNRIPRTPSEIQNYGRMGKPFCMQFDSDVTKFELVPFGESSGMPLDLDFINNWIIVRNTKDKEDRITLLVPSLQTELKILCENLEGEDLFDIKIGYIKYTFEKLNEMLNYKRHLNAYQLRHGFAHHCLKQGIDLKRVQEMLGHWDIKMTEEYLSLEPHEIIDVAVKKFKFKKGSKK